MNQYDSVIIHLIVQEHETKTAPGRLLAKENGRFAEHY